jgi:CRP-like cAMP-binding protein
MSPDPRPTITYRNQLLNALTADDLALLKPQFEALALPSREVLERPHTRIGTVYFIETGIASVVALSPRGRRIEVGIVGREGMTGMTVVMGNSSSPHETYMQVAGSGLRIGSDALREAMSASVALRDMFLHYAQAFMIQTAHTALANGHAKLEERLARWLLMAHDRLDSDELPLVHEFLALMLGVRRAGVTVAVQELEAEGVIQAERGRIKVIDRKGLEELANGSYGVPEAEYRRLIG